MKKIEKPTIRVVMVANKWHKEVDFFCSKCGILWAQQNKSYNQSVYINRDSEEKTLQTNYYIWKS